MLQGVRLLYQAPVDPFGAEALFRQVLARTPTHYGARYQLAVALDSTGRPTVARAVWQEVLAAAQSIGDSATIRTAAARLAAADVPDESAAMRLGLRYLYVVDSAAAAIDQFRLVLRQNSTHYGATFQLAKSLDIVGRGPEARPVWVRMLGMAVAANDTATARIARERLR